MTNEKAKREKILTLGNLNKKLNLKKIYTALTILPDLIQRVQTFLRPLPPVGS
jgi:hypothetical protein